MTSHKTGTREEWLAARLELLEAEKELTRRGDDVSRRRQELPWVRVDKDYRFETDEGTASLTDLFRGRSQLLVYHFMFGPDYTAGCPSCSAIADGFNGSAVHLAGHDVTLCVVSRAPFAKLGAYKRRMGWSFPWVSSYGSDFNFDFGVAHTIQEWEAGAVAYNFGKEDLRPTGRPRGCPRRLQRVDRRHGLADVPARGARHERIRSGGRHRLPQLFHVRARTGHPVGHVPVARPRAARPQRDRFLVAPARRVRQPVSEVGPVPKETSRQICLFASVNLNGTLAHGDGVTGVTHLGTGRYEVTFSADVRQCAYVATTINAYSQALQVFTAGGHLGADGVYVETKNQGGGLTDGPCSPRPQKTGGRCRARTSSPG